MSIELVSRVLNASLGVSSTGKLVLVGLANHADPDGTHVFPSLARLARYAGCDIRTVRRHLRSLEAANLIETVAEARQHRPTEYRIREDRLPALESRGDIHGRPGGTSEVARGDTAMSPYPSVPVIEPSPPAHFDEFWKVYPLKRGKAPARKAFTKALKKATAEEILAGVRSYAAERSGQDPSKTKWAEGWLNDERWTDQPSPNGRTEYVPSYLRRAQDEQAEREALAEMGISL